MHATDACKSSASYKSAGRASKTLIVPYVGHDSVPESVGSRSIVTRIHYLKNPLRND
jgi:hypothetical protein